MVVSASRYLVLLSACALVVSACTPMGVDTSSRDLECRDGYVATRHEGCADHGGVQTLMDDMIAEFKAVAPTGQPSHYLCADGWRSSALGRQGACSGHGGVWSTVWPDGTQVLNDGSIVAPDGTAAWGSE